jgi:hypothetical protein
LLCAGRNVPQTHVTVIVTVAKRIGSILNRLDVPKVTVGSCCSDGRVAAVSGASGITFLPYIPVMLADWRIGIGF